MVVNGEYCLFMAWNWLTTEITNENHQESGNNGRPSSCYWWCLLIPRWSYPDSDDSQAEETLPLPSGSLRWMDQCPSYHKLPATSSFGRSFASKNLLVALTEFKPPWGMDIGGLPRSIPIPEGSQTELHWMKRWDGSGGRGDGHALRVSP